MDKIDLDPDVSHALALLAYRDPARFDMTIAGKGWRGITDEERAWASQAYEAKYGRPMKVPPLQP